MAWVGGQEGGSRGVRKLEGGSARLGCRVEGTWPLGVLTWALGEVQLNNSLNPLTVWEEEVGAESGAEGGAEGGVEGRLYGLQQSLSLPYLPSLTGSSVYCHYSQRDQAGALQHRSSLEAVVLPSPPSPPSASQTALPAWVTWMTAGGLVLLLQLSLGLACLIARCALTRNTPSQ